MPNLIVASLLAKCAATTITTFAASTNPTIFNMRINVIVVQSKGWEGIPQWKQRMTMPSVGGLSSSQSDLGVLQRFQFLRSDQITLAIFLKGGRRKVSSHTVGLPFLFPNKPFFLLLDALRENEIKKNRPSSTFPILVNDESPRVLFFVQHEFLCLPDWCPGFFFF